MSQSSLPSMRIILFSNQPPPLVNAVVESLGAMGQQVLLVVTTPGTRSRPNENYHRMVAQFDTGPILVQRAMDIAEDDDIDSVFSKLLTLGGPLLPEALAAVAAGVPGTPQPVEGSYAPMVTEAERNLDWNRSAVQLRNQVRAWGSQGALARIDGKVYLVRRARVVPTSSPAQPGTVLERSDERLLVQAGQDALLIEDFREA